MKVSVATSGYGIIDLTNVFTVLANTYIENGKQISFLASGIPAYNSGYYGKLLFEANEEKLYIGGSGNWLPVIDVEYEDIELLSGYLHSGYIA